MLLFVQSAEKKIDLNIRHNFNTKQKHPTLAESWLVWGFCCVGDTFFVFRYSGIQGDSEGVLFAYG